MASGPWFFYETGISIKGVGGNNSLEIVFTDFHLLPSFPDSPRIDINTWVSASVAEVGSEGQIFLGQAPFWVANVVPGADHGVWVRVGSRWPEDLNGQLRLIFWTGVP